MHETAKVPNAPGVSVAFSIPAAAPSAPPAPISLVDGRSSFALRSVSSTTRITGPLATTEMRLVFENPEPRVREGRFRLALPERSFVTRVAMKVDGVFREADSVALPHAREVYEETLHARRDPLLVEQSENELSARVFPIPAEGEKEIIVGWTSEVTEALPVRIPLRGLGAIEHIEATVTDAGEPVAHVEFHGGAPSEDLTAKPRNSMAAIHAGAFVVARVRVSLASPSEPIEASFTILVDTSGSHASSFTTELQTVSDVITELARVEPNAHLTIAAFDQGVEVVHEGALRSFDVTAMTRLRRHGALGASDLRAALAWAASRGGRALLVGDGLATAGSSERATLLLATRGLARLDVVATGDARDDATLRALTMATPSAGVVARGDGAAIAARLRKKTELAYPVVMTGTRWMSPRTLSGVQDGDERMVYAELLAPPPEAAARPDPADERIVERAVAKARIDAMAETAALDGWRDADRAEVLALARSFRLASPLTAQIVVETDADRAGLFAPPSSASPPASPHPSSAPVGAHIAKVPTLRMAGAIEVAGRLPPESVQRTVRQHAGTFRGCYAEGLLRNPKLRGRVTTKFRIGRNGLSSDAVDGGSDLGDRRVVECIMHAFDGVQFTPPAGGVITVIYPLSLRPRGKEADENEGVEAVSYDIMHYLPSPSAPLSPWTGFYQQARLELAAGAPGRAFAIAASARTANASDGLALIALGEARKRPRSSSSPRARMARSPIRILTTPTSSAPPRPASSASDDSTSRSSCYDVHERTARTNPRRTSSSRSRSCMQGLFRRPSTCWSAPPRGRIFLIAERRIRCSPTSSRWWGWR